MNLIQFVDTDGVRRVALVNNASLVTPLAGSHTVRNLALAAIAVGRSLTEHIDTLPRVASIPYAPILEEGRVLAPLDHPDPAHCLVAGTGLTHLGSAQARDSMHSTLAADESTLSDSMKIFRWGVEGGKPTDGSAPVQPEWFYKGDGSIIAAPGQALVSPSFADDGGEEAELAGLYVVADNGTPHRVGFALGNEFSDHVMEKKNYLYLAHSKLRPASIGPEVFVGELPPDIANRVSLHRGGNELWSATVPTGEANMSYTFAGLEYHHFKYAAFRQPGDVHIHFFGTAALSYGAGIRLQDGDTMTITAAPFHLPLNNPIHLENDARFPGCPAL